VLGQALEIDSQQAVAIRIDADAVAASHEVIPSLLRDLVQTDGGQASNASPNREHAALAELASESLFTERALKLEALLRLETSRVLKLAPERIKSNQPFGQMGIDSLMALEFIRRVNAALGLALPATAVFNYPTLTLLTAQILKRLGLDSDAIAEPVSNAIDLAEREADETSAELSEDEALRALMEPGEPSSGD
jgi:acyl carrier protein